MAMKRLREEEESVEDIETIRTANFLVLLSRGGSDQSQEGELPTAQPSGRVFECKTCNRQFASFQALGGHRASHKKPKIVDDHKHDFPAKAKVHECSICGLEFGIGQALGGHMRRHRNIAAGVEGFPVVPLVKKSGNKKVCLDLDLNLTPSEAEQPELGFGTMRLMLSQTSFVH